MFEGAAIGDTIELEVELPGHFEPSELGGETAQVRYTIERQRVVIPAELDEEFLGKLQVSSEDELRQRIREGLDAQRARFRDEQVDHEIEKQLLEVHEFELPERLLAKSIDHRVHEVAHKLMKEQDLSAEDGHQQAEGQREAISEAAVKGLRLAFLLDVLGRKHNLQADVAAAEEQVRAMASQQQSDPAAAVADAHKEGWLGDVREQLNHQNVRNWLRQRAEVTETESQPAVEAGAADD